MAMQRSASAGGTTTAEPDAHVEDEVHLGVADLRGPLDEREDRRRRQRSSMTKPIGAATRARLSRPSPVMWSDAFTARPASISAIAGRDVDHGRLEQLLAERASELGDVVVEAQAGALEQQRAAPA